MSFGSSGDRDLADLLFKKKEFGSAKVQYTECLEKTREYNSGNKQLIEYLEMKIKECEEHQRKGK